jgi:hypothetical protein
MDRAIVSGMRYVIHSPQIRTVICRSLVFGLLGSSIAALNPIIARDSLHGGAGTYGLMLGLYGAGAVVGAMLTGHVRARFKAEHAVSLLAAVTGTVTSSASATARS